MLGNVVNKFLFPYHFHIRTVIFSVGTRSKSFFGPVSLFPLPPLALILIIHYTDSEEPGYLPACQFLRHSIKEFILYATFRKLLAEKAVQ